MPAGFPPGKSPQLLLLTRRVMRFGLFEFGLIVLLLIVLFGGWRTGRVLGKTYGTYRKVNEARNDLKRRFSPGRLLRLDNDNKEKD